jgi:lysyl endopeptidase
MKKIIYVLSAFFCFGNLLYSQISEGGRPISFVIDNNRASVFDAGHEVLNLAEPNLTYLRIDDVENDNLGRPYRVGVNIPVNKTPENAGKWSTLSDGTRVWQLSITSKNAMALGLYFAEEVVIPTGGKLFVYNKNKTQVLGAYTANTPRFQAMEMVEGDYLTLEYIASPQTIAFPTIEINNVAYFYRGVEDHVNKFKKAEFLEKAESCQVDVACTPERNGWEDQINSVVHYTFTEGQYLYVCSGATINNTALDCKPYILTAWHCGEPNANSNISTWVWYWNYQKASCAPNNNGSNPSKGTQTMTGGTVRASSGNGTLNNPPGNNQVAGSDFYLVELNSAIPANYNAYLAGWNRTNTAATSGVGIHHPDGSAKKISTYTSSLVSTTYNGGAANAHWRVIWSATTNGHGVTEGGSSGSPIFNQAGLIVGQLSGGSSYCNATTQPDLYGKMYTNWDQSGTGNAARLQPWLDPTNSGVTTLSGTYQPCTAQAPVADFSANQTTVTPSTTVTFTDLSTNNPTSWSWSISPSTGWAYAGGTTANSQNPQITFNTVGQYTVTLTATNNTGTDAETKTNYITVSETVVPDGPCAATSSGCDEFIQNVTLGTINNTTVCTNYGDYTNLSTSLTRGQNYSVTVMPQITGNQIGTAYTNDEIAVWIDFNGNGVFTDPGERVGYVIVGEGWSPVFNFTVPLTATTGSVVMRCRISYQPEDGDISPCGTTNWGEVEDYTINLVAESTSTTLTLNCGITTDEINQSESTLVPNYVPGASAQTTCQTTGVTITQSPVAGSTLNIGLNTITLTATDNCGNTQTCTIATTLINDNTGLSIHERFANGVNIFPNPTTGNVFIDISETGLSDFDIALFDLSGKLLFQDKVNTSTIYEMNMERFATGMYQIRIQSGNAVRVSKISKM